MVKYIQITLSFFFLGHFSFSQKEALKMDKRIYQQGESIDYQLKIDSNSMLLATDGDCGSHLIVRLLDAQDTIPKTISYLQMDCGLPYLSYTNGAKFTYLGELNENNINKEGYRILMISDKEVLYSNIFYIRKED